MPKYCIGRTPKLTSIRNIQSWAEISDYLQKHHAASQESQISVVIKHDHASGGKGFIKYCNKNDWLVEVND